MLSSKMATLLKQLIRGTPITKAQNWLKTSHINAQAATGWPTIRNQTNPSVWGGTLDGIRGLYSTGVSSYDPILEDSLNWLLSQQRDDGGFQLDDGPKDETFSSVEATAWVLITLKDIGVNLGQHKQAKKAIRYLESCVGIDGEMGTSMKDLDNPRTYPCLLTVWACNGFSRKVNSVVQHLKDMQDPFTGGWGTKAGVNPNPSITSQLLFVLLSNGFLARDDHNTLQAVEYIISNQYPDGHWENCAESWFSHNELRYPNSHNEYTTPWAVTALMSFGYSAIDEPVARGVSWLIKEQETDGCWIYDNRQKTQYIWCTSITAIALVAARENLLLAMSDASVDEFLRYDR